MCHATYTGWGVSIGREACEVSEGVRHTGEGAGTGGIQGRVRGVGACSREAE